MVLQIQPRAHCVIPEQNIFSIEKIEADIKTWGVNKQHKHLVFWSNDSLDAPNFELPLSTEFPPNNSACYHARIKRFFRKYMIFFVSK